MRRYWLHRRPAAAVVHVLVSVAVGGTASALAGCSVDAPPSSGHRPATASMSLPAGAAEGSPTAQGLPIYLAEANLTAELGAQLPRGSMGHVTGVRAGSAIPQEFVDRLVQVNPGLASYDYAAAAYDAVMISALAAAYAGADGSRAWPAAVHAVTSGEVPCSAYADCSAHLAAGDTIAYVGVSGVGHLADGLPTLGTAGRYTFDVDNRLSTDPEVLDVVTGTAEDEGDLPPAGPPPAESDGILRWGLPQVPSSSLGFLNPAIEAGARLAVDEVSDAGGVRGYSGVEILSPEDGTLADRSIGALLNANVDIVIVPATDHSQQSEVIAAATSADVLTMAPMAVSRAGLPPRSRPWLWSMEAWQPVAAAALSDVLMSDGRSTVALLHIDDDYGRGLAQAVEKAITARGGSVAMSLGYPVGATDYSRVVAAARKGDPDAVVLLGTDETSEVIEELRAQEHDGPMSPKPAETRNS